MLFTPSHFLLLPLLLVHLITSTTLPTPNSKNLVKRPANDPVCGPEHGRPPLFDCQYLITYVLATYESDAYGVSHFQDLVSTWRDCTIQVSALTPDRWVHYAWLSLIASMDIILAACIVPSGYGGRHVIATNPPILIAISQPYFAFSTSNMPFSLSTTTSTSTAASDLEPNIPDGADNKRKCMDSADDMSDPDYGRQYPRNWRCWCGAETVRKGMEDVLYGFRKAVGEGYGVWTCGNYMAGVIAEVGSGS